MKNINIKLNSNFSIKIDLKYIIFLFAVYPFFKTYYFSIIGIMPKLNYVLLCLSFVIIFVFYFKIFLGTSIKNQYNIKKLNNGIYFLLVYYLLIFFSNLLSRTISFEYFTVVAYTLAFALLVNYCLYNKEDLLYLFSTIYFLLYIYTITNLISIFIFPNGIPSIVDFSNSPMYIFGNIHSFIKLALPGLCFAFLYDLLKYKKITLKSRILFLVAWFTVIYTWSVTSILGLTIFSFILLVKIRKWKLSYNYYIILVLSLCATAFLIFFRYESSILEYILGLFGKDLTFSNRDRLWNNAINSVSESLIFGYGVLNPLEIWELVGNRYGSHNYYLDTVLRGGLLSFVLLISGLIYLGKKIKKYENNIITRVLVGVCCAYFVMFITEPFMSTEFIFLSIFFILINKIDLLLKYYND